MILRRWPRLLDQLWVAPDDQVLIAIPEAPINFEMAKIFVDFVDFSSSKPRRTLF